MLPLALAAQKKENANSAISRNLELFNDIYKQLDLFYVDSLNADTVIGWGIRSMLQQVDPFTDYFPDDDEDLRQMATGKYAGIGSVIRYHKKEQRAVISEPYEGTPSQKAGVQAGDVILSIDGKDVKGMLTPKVSSMLRGEAGTTFELKVRRGEEEKSFLITRQTIQLPQVPYSGMLADGQTGYIYLTGFTEGACREVRDALDEVRRQGAKRLVFDLRGNPGGAINEAVDIANLFLPKGKKVVYTRGKMTRTNREYYTATEPVDSMMPLIVLVDGGSASASETNDGSETPPFAPLSVPTSIPITSKSVANPTPRMIVQQTSQIGHAQRRPYLGAIYLYRPYSFSTDTPLLYATITAGISHSENRIGRLYFHAKPPHNAMRMKFRLSIPSILAYWLLTSVHISAANANIAALRISSVLQSVFRSIFMFIIPYLSERLLFLIII